jgi:hypothetical protein
MAAPARRSSAADPLKRSRTACKFFAEGKCSRNPCGFAHTTAGLSAAAAFSVVHARNSKSAAKGKPGSKPRKAMLIPPAGVCKYSWNRRPCPYGSECRYTHHVADYTRPDSDDDRRGPAFNERDEDGGGDQILLAVPATSAVSRHMCDTPQTGRNSPASVSRHSPHVALAVGWAAGRQNVRAACRGG